MSTALVIGATGLVGSHLLDELSHDNYYREIIVLSRRPVTYTDPRIRVALIDFDRPDESLIKADHVFCAIGTTLRKAGSKENQRRIDYEYPVKLAEIARRNGARKFILVSSIGADAHSSNFYLRTKGELEEKLRALKFESLVILRPSILLGARKEFRAGEKIGIFLVKLLRPLMTGGLRKYRGVEAADVAKAMLNAAQTANSPEVLIASEQIHD